MPVKVEDVLRSLSTKKPKSLEEIARIERVSLQHVLVVYETAMAKMRARLKLAGAQ